MNGALLIAVHRPSSSSLSLQTALSPLCTSTTVVLAMSSNGNRGPIELRQRKSLEPLGIARCRFIEPVHSNMLAEQHAKHVVRNAPVDAGHVAALTDVRREFVELTQDGEVGLPGLHEP